MKIALFIDLLQRRINSVLFRFVLISYATFILLIEKNLFPVYIYIIGTVLFFILYIQLLKHSVGRLFNDFWFIAFILIGKNPNESYNYVLIILPIINTINFSGNKTSPFLYLFTIAIYYIIGFYFRTYTDQLFPLKNLRFISPILFLYVINKYTEIRVKYRQFSESLTDIVDSFYLEKDNIRKSRKVYKHIIDTIHENKRSFNIDNIFCFTVVHGKNERLLIVNGSSFIWNYEFKNSSLINTIRVTKVAYDEPIEIEGKNKNTNLILYTQVFDKEYLFVFISRTKIPVFYRTIGIFRTLEPVVLKISKVLISELKLQEIRNEELRELAVSSQYVSRANKIMHFIRNRLSSPSNLLKMLDNMPTVPPDKSKDYMNLLEEEKERTKLDIKSLLDRANDMLEKGNNPFDFKITTKIHAIKVYIILEKMYSHYFPDYSINLFNVSNISNRLVDLNEMGFEFFLSDWLKNMEKYNKGSVSCDFTFKDEKLFITFRNNHPHKIDDVRKMISDLTNIDRNEIMRRTTQGLFNIKSTLDDMGVLFEINNDDSKNELIFTLILKTSTHENLSI